MQEGQKISLRDYVLPPRSRNYHENQEHQPGRPDLRKSAGKPPTRVSAERQRERADAS